MTEKIGSGIRSRICVLQSAYVIFIASALAYLTMVTHYSPFYFGYLTAFICMVCSAVCQRRFLCDKNLISIIVWMGAAVLFAVVNSAINGMFRNFSTYLVQIFINQGSLFLVCFLLKNGRLDMRAVKKGLDMNYYVTVVLGAVDFVHRVQSSEWLWTGNMWFYNLKFHSYMFQDTNWCGFAYMISFAFYLYLMQEHRLVSRKRTAVLFGLVILSFSRAAMIGCGLVWLWAVFIHPQKGRKKAAYYMVFLIILIFAGIAGFHVLKNSGSFIARLSIIDGMIYYLKHADLSQILLGNGFDADEGALFGAAWTFKHLYFVIKIVDIGIIGTAIETGILIMILQRTKGEMLYLLIPFFTAGLSFSPTNLSYLYIFAGIMLYIEYSVRSCRTDFRYCVH